MAHIVSKATVLAKIVEAGERGIQDFVLIQALEADFDRTGRLINELVDEGHIIRSSARGPKVLKVAPPKEASVGSDQATE